MLRLELGEEGQSSLKKSHSTSHEWLSYDRQQEEDEWPDEQEKHLLNPEVTAINKWARSIRGKRLSFAL